MLVLSIFLAASTAQISTGAPPSALPFVHKEELFASQSFDTGWTPPQGPVQVRMSVDVGTGFYALAGGTAHLTWSPLRQLWAEGNQLGGLLKMNAGVEVKTRLKLTLNLPGGNTINWEGPIPSAPNFDYRFANEQAFTPFLLPGQSPDSVQVADSIMQTKLYSVPLTEAIIPIPGIGGYLDIYAGGTLEGTLKGKVVRFVEYGEQVAHTQRLPWEVPANDSVKTVVQYEAELTREGTLNLEPKVSLHIGPVKWNLASINVPIDLPPTTTLWKFDDQQVDFGLGRLIAERGDGTLVDAITLKSGLDDFPSDRFFLRNAGKTRTAGTLTIEGNGFVLDSSAAFDLFPGDRTELRVHLKPLGAGTFEGKLGIASNDPASPKTIPLHATIVVETAGTGGGDGTDGTGEATEPEVGTLKDGCDCNSVSSATWLQALAFVSIGLLRKRRAR